MFTCDVILPEVAIYVSAAALVNYVLPVHVMLCINHAAGASYTVMRFPGM
jgi:hypothetical protein